MQCACAVLYCHLLPVRLYHVFPHYFVNGANFGETLLKIIFFFIFFTILYQTLLSLRRIQSDTIHVHWSSCTVTVTLVRCQQSLNFFDRISKNSNIKLHQNSSSGRRVVAWGQTDWGTDGQKDWRTERHGEANSHLSQFFKRALKSPMFQTCWEHSAQRTLLGR